MTWIVSTQLAGAAIPLLVLKSGVYNLDSAAIKPFSHNPPFLLRRIMVHLVLSIYLVFCVGQILLKYSEIVINLVKQRLADFVIHEVACRTPRISSIPLFDFTIYAYFASCSKFPYWTAHSFSHLISFTCVFSLCIDHC